METNFWIRACWWWLWHCFFGPQNCLVYFHTCTSGILYHFVCSWKIKITKPHKFLKNPSLSRVMIIVSDSFIVSYFNTMRHIKIIYGYLPLDLIYWHILVYFQWVGLSKDSISEPQQDIKIYLTSLSLIIHCQVFAITNQSPRDKGLLNNIVTNVALFIVTKLYFITFIF